MLIYQPVKRKRFKKETKGKKEDKKVHLWTIYKIRPSNFYINILDICGKKKVNMYIMYHEAPFSRRVVFFREKAQIF